MFIWNIYSNLLYFMAIWWFSGNLVYVFSLILVYCVKKNLATLLRTLLLNFKVIIKIDRCAKAEENTASKRLSWDSVISQIRKKKLFAKTQTVIF
jgi:hypothetical protein